jgi:poly-gamma-glutamate synthesis protein (capsule biosynthesis protein)
MMPPGRVGSPGSSGAFVVIVMGRRGWIEVWAAVASALAVWSCDQALRDRDVRLLFVGDMMLGRHVDALMREREDWTLPFRPLGARLRAADLAFGNLESVIARSGTARGTIPFRAAPESLAGLQFAGFDVISVANNHAADFGPQALAEMLGHLERGGIAHVGLDGGASLVQEVVVHDLGGLRIGFLAFSHGVEDAEDDPVRVAKLTGKGLVRSIRAARPVVDYLIVSIHVGKQFEPRSTAPQQGIARAAVDVGADLVVGHHPHVPQEIERYRGRIIAYSLGDFVFDHPEASVDGAILELTLRDGRPEELVYVRTRINEHFQPEAVSEERWGAADLEGPDLVLN